MQKSKAVILDSLKKIKGNVDTFIKENHVDELQKSVKKMIEDAKKDLGKVVDKDIAKVKAKVLKETQHVEKILDKNIRAEMVKAKKFLEVQKKEIAKIQAKAKGLVGSKVKSKVQKKSSKKKAGSASASSEGSSAQQ